VHAPHYHKIEREKKNATSTREHKQEGQRNIRDSTTMAQLTTSITCPQDVQAHTSAAQHSTSRYHYGQILHPYLSYSYDTGTSGPPPSTTPYHNYHTHNTIPQHHSHPTLPYPAIPCPPPTHTPEPSFPAQRYIPISKRRPKIENELSARGGAPSLPPSHIYL